MQRVREKSAELAGRRAPNQPTTPTPMTPQPDDQRFLEQQLAAQERYNLLTNDIVKISGRQPPRVNGKPLALKTHARTVLLFLATQAIDHPGDYFSTDDIVLAIERRGRALGELKMSWNQPTPGQIFSAVSQLRSALGKNRLNENLVESVRGKGYRLSTPAMNILYDFPGGENLARLSEGPFPRGGEDAPMGYRRPLSQ